MKKVTSVTFWNDAVGKRLSITYKPICEKYFRLPKIYQTA